MEDALASRFAGVNKVPDEPFETYNYFLSDMNPMKMYLDIDIGNPIMFEESGRAWTPQLVKSIAKRFSMQESVEHDLLYKTFGHVDFGTGVSDMLLGIEIKLAVGHKVNVFQSLDGLGGISIVLSALRRISRCKKYTCLNQYLEKSFMSVLRNSGIEEIFWKIEKPNGITALPSNQDILNHLKRLDSNTVVILDSKTMGQFEHGQEDKFIDALMHTQAIPVIWLPAIGFETGTIEGDTSIIRTLASRQRALFVVTSFSNNLGLYGESVGAVLQLADSIPEKVAFARFFEIRIFTTYVGPPWYGGLIAARALRNSHYFIEWTESIKKMRGRVMYLRNLLKDKLNLSDTNTSWEYLTENSSFIQELRIPTQQCMILLNKFHIYINPNGLFNISALKKDKIDYFVKCIKESFSLSYVPRSRYHATDLLFRPGEEIKFLKQEYNQNLFIKGLRTKHGEWYTPFPATFVERRMPYTAAKIQFSPFGCEKLHDKINDMIFIPYELDEIKYKMFSFQTVGKKGAFYLLLNTHKQLFGHNVIYYAAPGQDNFDTFYKQNGLKVHHFRYLDSENCKINFSGMCQDIRKAPPHSFIILQTSCSFPTGYDLNLEQWDTIIKIITDKDLIPILLMPTPGLCRTTLQTDVDVCQKFVRSNLDFVIVISLSAIFGYYDEKMATLKYIISDECAREKIKISMHNMVLANYKIPPIFGAAIITKILSDTFYFEWKKSLELLCLRLEAHRALIVATLNKKCFRFNRKSLGDWNHILKQSGYYCHLGLTGKQVEYLLSKYKIHISPSSCINITALREHSNLDYVCSAICDAKASS